MDKDETLILAGQDAIDLWLKGKNAWNAWVEENPFSRIDFSRIDFSQYRKKCHDNKLSVISFKSFLFPKGILDFSNADFGVGDVDFRDTDYGGELVLFDGATFSEGSVSFIRANIAGFVSFEKAKFVGFVTFKKANFAGSVSFEKAKFGKGGSFCNANFGGGTFDDADFGVGVVDFSDAKFGELVSFCNANFGKGTVFFNRTNFSRGGAFIGANFGEGHISFQSSNFGEGPAIFDRAIACEAFVYFDKTNFGVGPVTFDFVAFEHLIFEEVITVKSNSISFKSCVFNKTLSLSNNNFPFVIDLINTKIIHHISLAGLNCHFDKVWWSGKARNKDDIARLRRLKELAETNKAHQQALHFHSEEQRAKRWHETKLFHGLGLDYLFDLFSRYGQSIGRPFIALLLTISYFGFLFSIVATVSSATYKDGLIFSLTNVLPFLPNNRLVSLESKIALFGIEGVPYEVYYYIYGQGLVSFALLFLIGLAFKNRFRV